MGFLSEIEIFNGFLNNLDESASAFLSVEEDIVIGDDLYSFKEARIKNTTQKRQRVIVIQRNCNNCEKRMEHVLLGRTGSNREYACLGCNKKSKLF